MEETKCNEIFEQLKTSLKDFKLNWIVEQVENEIRIGKLSEEEPENGDIKYTFDFYDNRQRPKSKMSYIKEYSAKDKLILLLNAIEEVIINIPSMENSLLFNLQDKPFHIEFYSEDPNINSFTITRETTLKNVELSRKLNILLDELRIEVHK